MTASCLLMLEERDLDFPLDHDGCPTVSGKLWLIQTAAITAVEVTPENTRGIVVRIHVHGIKTPVVPCDSEAVLEALGARVGSICGGHLVWAESRRGGGGRRMTEDRDYVTVLRVKGGGRANKQVARQKDGSIEKSGVVETGRYDAVVVHVPDAAAMAALLNQIGEDPSATMMLGYFPEQPVGEVFEIWSRKRLLRHKGLNHDAMSPAERERQTTGRHEVNGVAVYTRTRGNTRLSSWTLFDRDIVRDMPAELVELVFVDWLAELGDVFPTLDKAAVVVVPSTSGRVLIDGEPWSSKASWHAYVQVDDPDDFRNRVWDAALVKTFSVNVLLTDCPLGVHAPRIFASGPDRAGDEDRDAVEHLGSDHVPQRTAGLRRQAGSARPDERQRPDRGAGERPRAAGGRPPRLLGVRRPVRTRAAQRRAAPNAAQHETRPARRAHHRGGADPRSGGRDRGRRHVDPRDLARGRGPRPHPEPLPGVRSWAAFVGFHAQSGAPFLYDMGSSIKYVLAEEDRRGTDSPRSSWPRSPRGSQA